ncbi:MAG: hypothetical protein R3245_05825, partial [Kiloniellales bacterium]|nr:hypothetical protein [Kiloniellales bacterium]
MEALGQEVIRLRYQITLGISSKVDFKLRLARDCEAVEGPITEAIEEHRPDAILLHRPVRIRPRLLEAAQKRGIAVMIYHNDNVFQL